MCLKIRKTSTTYQRRKMIKSKEIALNKQRYNIDQSRSGYAQ